MQENPCKAKTGYGSYSAESLEEALRLVIDYGVLYIYIGPLNLLGFPKPLLKIESLAM